MRLFSQLAVEGKRLLLKELIFTTLILICAVFDFPRFFGPLLIVFLAGIFFTCFFFRDQRFVLYQSANGILTAPSYDTVMKTCIEGGIPIIKNFPFSCGVCCFRFIRYTKNI